MDSSTLGPAERIINTAITFSDHCVHNRPGVLYPYPGSVVGVNWKPGIWKLEDGKKIFYERRKKGRKSGELIKVGEIHNNGAIYSGRTKAGEYRKAGLYEEVVAWLYQQVADIWKMDNEFAAHWASHVYKEDKKDFKVLLAAFMLVQNRCGETIKVGDSSIRDEDYRDVGEAMCLLTSTDLKSYKGLETGVETLQPRLLLRVGNILNLDSVATINRKLGFGGGGKRPPMGRWPVVVRKWLSHREDNPKMLSGLVKNGMRTTVMKLARAIHYQPSSNKFFDILHWNQVQAKDGRRQFSIGVKHIAEDWSGLTEEAICERIVSGKINMKRVVGMLPPGASLTKAIVAAVIESGGMSDKDIVNFSPTLEELGLMATDGNIKARWRLALKNATDTRAANIAARMKVKENADVMETAADEAVQKAIAEDMKQLHVYLLVDKSGSMERSLELGKDYTRKFVQAFPLDKLHASVFDTSGHEVIIKAQTAAGVELAFRGISAAGGTRHAAGIEALAKHPPKDDEDSLMIFIGDEGENYNRTFEDAVKASGLRPTAFALIKVPGENGSAVRDTAALLQIPCFMIDQRTFGDVYAIPQTLRALIAATPVGKVVGTRAAPAIPRVTLVDKIMQTPLLQRPVWA